MSDVPASTDPAAVAPEPAQPEPPKPGPPEPATPEPQEVQETAEVDPEVRKLRDEAASWRTKFREQEKAYGEQATQLEELNKFKSKFDEFFTDGGNTPDPEQVAKEQADKAAEWQSKYNALLADKALTDAVAKAGADPELAPLIVKNTDQFQKLDPTQDGYVDQVVELVNGVVESHPKLAAQVAPPRSGSSQTPADNASAKLTREDLQRLADKGDWDAINKAVSDGRINP